MLEDLNETLRRLLIDQLGTDGIDVSFEQPTREWSARIQRPTVNVFLLRLLENRHLRDIDWQALQEKQRFQQQWRPRRVDVFYMVTAWATEPADEFLLLWRALAVLMRHPELPEECYVGEMHDQERPVPVEVAQTEILENPSEIWSALNNEFKPSVSLKVTLELDLALIVERPLVLTARFLFRDRDLPDMEAEQFIQIGGTVYDRQGTPLAQARVRVVERDQAATTDAEGHFTFVNVPTGEYTLEATTPDGDVRRRQVSWGNSKDYDFTF